MTLHQVLNDDVLKVHMQNYGLYSDSEKENEFRILINTEEDNFAKFYLEMIQEYSGTFRGSLSCLSQITASLETPINLNRGANAPA